MTWIVLAFGSVFFFTSQHLLQRVLAINSKNPRAMAVLFNGVAASFALLIFVATGSFKNFTLPSAPAAWIALLIASFCYAMFERGRFFAAKLLDVSVLTTIKNISALIAFVGALFLYSESLTIQKLSGGILIIGALFLVSIRNNKTRKSSTKGILIAIVISIMLGLASMLDKLGTQFFNAITYSIFVWVVPLFFIIFPGIKLSAVKTELKLASWKIFLLAGLNVAGYLMGLKALELTEATKVIPISQTSTLFTILAGIVLLRERDRVPIKIIAGLMAMIGVYLLI